MRPFYSALVLTLLAIASLVVWADPAHRWHRALRPPPRSMGPGEVYLHAPDVDDRALKAAMITQQPAADTVLLGSSRVMNVTASMVPASRSTLNLGVSGASVEDYAALWQAVREAGKTPRRLLVFVDPWIFNASSDQQRWVTNAALVDRFLRTAPVERGTGLRARVAWAALAARGAEAQELVTWASVRAAIGRAVRAARGRSEDEGGGVLTDEARAAPDASGTRADGSHRYPERQTRERADIADVARAFAAQSPVYSLGNWTVDPGAVEVMRALLADVRAAKTDVTIILPPYHRLALEGLAQRPEYASVLGEYRDAVARIARATPGVAVCDAVDPASSGCLESEFMDGMHALPSCTERVLARCLAGDAFAGRP